MSSPSRRSQGVNQRPPQQHQEPPLDSNTDMDEDGVSIRAMRLKVLYTFDDQNKTNCLARGENVLQVKTVALDETTSIGILDLKTCIETVVRCSPELLNRVGQDYTVYAYDYSEYDNPLVGQGMLSRVLASASPAPEAPALQSQKLITGRVCKNIVGFFNGGGVKETLEVKLRLVPVPTSMQGEYISTMEKYREINSNIPAGFDHNEWTKFLQSNPAMAQMANKSGAPASVASSHRGSMNMEVVNQLLSPSLQQAPLDPFIQTTNADSGNESRGGTNTGKGKKTSRPSSRAAVKKPRAKRQSKAVANTGGNTSGYEEGTDGDDGPAPRKRAKITQTDWKSKSSFGPATDTSLRVAASTSGSLRMFRPIAMSPAPAGSHLQEIPRAPTPIPNLPNQHQARDRESFQSSLRRDSFGSQADAPRQHISPYPPLDPHEEQIRDSIESANPSPERNFSPAGTPNIGSSPPVMRSASVIRSSPPCPSSPVLPQMPRTDSGFMSGSILDELFGDDDDLLFPDDEYVDEAPYLSRRRVIQEAKAQEHIHHGFAIEEETPGPMELLPTKMPIVGPPRAKPPKGSRSRGGSVMSDDGQTLPPLKKSRSRLSTRHPTPSQVELEVQYSQANKAQESAAEHLQALPTPPQSDTQNLAPQTAAIHPPSEPLQPRSGPRMLVRTASVGSLSLPAILANDPVLPPSGLHRSQSWVEAPHPFTEGPGQILMPAPMPPQLMMHMPMPAPESIKMNSKKASIRQKLEAAIANGEMPPYCSNCGAIETPTWRKAWSQEHEGAPGYHEYSDLPGRVTAIAILARDAEGNPTLHQLIKKFLGEGEDQHDWKEFMLCNPCGIWMSKYKSHRPEERWENAPKPPGAKRPSNRASKAKKNQSMGNFMPTSDANFPMSDMYYPPSEAYLPQSEAIGPTEGLSPTDTTGVQQQNLQVQRVEIPENPVGLARPPKPRLNAMTSGGASAALQRALRSSPQRWAGTQQSPIEVEENLGATRRLLFSSPRKDGIPKVLGDLEFNTVNLAKDISPSKEQAVEMTDKENCPPAFDEHDADADLLALFEEEMARPTTPVQNTPAPNPFKTPTRPTPSHRPITRSVSRSNRSAKAPGYLLMFGQQTLSKTPGSSARRRSPRNHQTVFESPFTASLNQLMSEANEQMSPSRQCNLELDFGHLPNLPGMDDAMQGGGMNFELNDFFLTDAPVPSSPPKMFQLYEDPTAMANVDWSQFDDQMLDIGLGQGSKEVTIKAEPTEGEELMEQGTEQPVQESAHPVQNKTHEPSETQAGQQKQAELQIEPVERAAEVATEKPTEDANDDDDEVDMVGMRSN